MNNEISVVTAGMYVYMYVRVCLLCTQVHAPYTISYYITTHTYTKPSPQYGACIHTCILIQHSDPPSSLLYSTTTVQFPERN